MIPDPILLVDDEADLRPNLKEALTPDGYRVEDAPDADGALALMADTALPGGAHRPEHARRAHRLRTHRGGEGPATRSPCAW